MLKLILGAGAGWAAAWFLDPNDGARRRNTTRDKAMKYARRSSRQAARTATYAGHTVKGKATAVSPTTSRPPAGERLNDQGLAAKVESEVFRDPDSPKPKVSVNVEDGIAYLRGEVEDSSTIGALSEAASKVDGVSAVENLLHTPGQPAPTSDSQ